MSQTTNLSELAQKRVLMQIPAMEAVVIRHDVTYRADDGDEQTLDIYTLPEGPAERRLPAVLFVSGYQDAGMQKFFGCKLKEMASYTSWGRLVAAAGLAAILYTNSDPATDVLTVMRYVKENAASLGLDETRLGLLAFSGNAPNALSVLMEEMSGTVKCAVLCYPMLLDLEEASYVANAAQRFGFVNPTAGKTVAHLPTEVPLMLIRAGQDEMPHLNETLDRFLAHAVRANLPVTFINHPTAPHFFDVMEDSEMTLVIIRRMLAFLRFHLGIVE